MVPTFVVLSCGYLLASRKEVDSVELPYLNRARLAFTSTKFLATGVCVGVFGIHLYRAPQKAANRQCSDLVCTTFGRQCMHVLGHTSAVLSEAARHLL